MRRPSIGVKLTFWYTALLTLTMLFLGAIAYALLSYSLSRDLDSALKGVADVLVERARIEGKAFFPSEVDDLFRRFFGFSPLDRYFEMFDPMGRRLRRQPRSPSSRLPFSPKALKNAAQGKATFESHSCT